LLHHYTFKNKSFLIFPLETLQWAFPQKSECESPTEGVIIPAITIPRVVASSPLPRRPCALLRRPRSAVPHTRTTRAPLPTPNRRQEATPLAPIHLRATLIPQRREPIPRRHRDIPDIPQGSQRAILHRPLGIPLQMQATRRPLLGIPLQMQATRRPLLGIPHKMQDIRPSRLGIPPPTQAIRPRPPDIPRPLRDILALRPVDIRHSPGVAIQRRHREGIPPATPGLTPVLVVSKFSFLPLCLHHICASLNLCFHLILLCWQFRDFNMLINMNSWQLSSIWGYGLNAPSKTSKKNKPSTSRRTKSLCSATSLSERPPLFSFRRTHFPPDVHSPCWLGHLC
jgi:hypothetical protein